MMMMMMMIHSKCGTESAADAADACEFGPKWAVLLDPHSNAWCMLT